MLNHWTRLRSCEQSPSIMSSCLQLSISDICCTQIKFCCKKSLIKKQKTKLLQYPFYYVYTTAYLNKPIKPIPIINYQIPKTKLPKYKNKCTKCIRMIEIRLRLRIRSIHTYTSSSYKIVNMNQFLKSLTDYRYGVEYLV